VRVSWQSSFLPERYGRVDDGGPPRGQETGRKRRAEHHGRNSDEGCSVGRSDLEEESGEEPAQREGDRDTEQNAPATTRIP
jgi:hypothetical protein